MPCLTRTRSALITGAAAGSAAAAAQVAARTPAHTVHTLLPPPSCTHRSKSKSSRVHSRSQQQQMATRQHGNRLENAGLANSTATKTLSAAGSNRWVCRQCLRTRCPAAQDVPKHTAYRARNVTLRSAAPKTHLQLIACASHPYLLLDDLQAPVAFIILLQLGICGLCLDPQRQSCTKLKLQYKHIK